MAWKAIFTLTEVKSCVRCCDNQLRAVGFLPVKLAKLGPGIRRLHLGQEQVSFQENGFVFKFDFWTQDTYQTCKLQTFRLSLLQKGSSCSDKVLKLGWRADVGRLQVKSCRYIWSFSESSSKTNKSLWVNQCVVIAYSSIHNVNYKPSTLTSNWREIVKGFHWKPQRQLDHTKAIEMYDHRCGTSHKAKLIFPCAKFVLGCQQEICTTECAREPHK